MIYSDRIKGLRADKGINQKDIAEILGLKRGHYSQYETEYVIMPIKHLNTLSNYFNVSIDYLFGFSTEKSYPSINKEIDNKIVASRLKEFRKKEKLTQLKLASILNTNQSVIANYERGRTIIATPFLYTICSKYNVSADYLLGKINNHF